jgi:hypothetical protein
MRLRLHPAALAELDEAVAWHEARRTGWGSQLVVAVAHTSREPKYWRGRLESHRNS